MLQGDGVIAAAPVDAIKDATTQSFMKDVIEESKNQPVLVDFWVKLVKMDIDKHPDIPGQMGIQSIPAVIAFYNGQPVDGFMGALPESQVTEFLQRLTKGKVAPEERDLLKEADEALAAGDPAAAANLYGELVTQDSGNVAALAGLARCYLETGALDMAKQTLALVPEAKNNDKAVAAARAALDVAEQALKLGPLDELEKKVAADPLDHQARFDLATGLNAAGKRTEAADHLLAIVKRDRKWNDDGARKQLVQFFEAWGPMDEATLEGRKKLSSILFS